MKVLKANDYETAFALLIDWLKESCDVVSENMPDADDDEVQFAKADGYLTCCSAAIVVAKRLRESVMKAGRDKKGRPSKG